MKLYCIIFILMLIIFTGCSKVEYDLNPWTTVLNKIVKQK
tara:strand:- start:394 stop:513 length:120 start_codon:yes stop_codon:yes gene_type:complete